MRSNLITNIVFIIAALFLGWFLFNPEFSDPIEYLLMLVFFVMIAWIIVVTYSKDQKERSYLISIFLIALGLRMLVSLLVHALLPPGYFAPDEVNTLLTGKIIAESWNGSNMLPTISSISSGIYYIAAAVFYIFGYKPNILFLLANFLGAMTVLNSYFITKRLFNEKSARYSAMAVTVLPSLVLWSSMPLKDIYTQFSITFIIHLTLRIKEKFKISDLLFILTMIVMIAFVRGYLVVIILMAIASTFVPIRKETFIRNAIVIAVFAMAFALFSSSYEAKLVPKYGKKSTGTLQEFQQTRQGFYQGGSKILGHINIANPVNAIIYSPLLLAVFFLAPFPWQISGSIIHNLATMESLVWYYFLYYAIKGIIVSFRQGKFDVLPVLVMIGVLSIAYALAISNIGAAYRFRAQVSVLLLVFTGFGIYLRNQERIKRRSLSLDIKTRHSDMS